MAHIKIALFPCKIHPFDFAFSIDNKYQAMELDDVSDAIFSLALQIPLEPLVEFKELLQGELTCDWFDCPANNFLVI